MFPASVSFIFFVLGGKEDFVVIMGSSWIRGSLLGAGAFGQVNLAMDRVTGAFFAVKSTVVSCSSSYQQGDVEDVVGAAVQPNSALAAMENEIRILQELDSEFVVRCLGSDWSEEGGKRMRNVFLEYMPGGSLSDVLKQFAGGAQQQQQPLDEQLIRSYTRSILQGIDYLHRRGIVHCDIKGKNVLVGNAGSVKLADFGSAKHVEEEEEVADWTETRPGDNGVGGGLWCAEGERDAVLDGARSRATKGTGIAFGYLVAGMYCGRDGHGSSSMGTYCGSLCGALPDWVHQRDAQCTGFVVAGSARFPCPLL